MDNQRNMSMYTTTHQLEKLLSFGQSATAEHPDLVRPAAQAAVNAQVLMLLSRGNV